MISPADLRRLLRFDAETGTLYWLERPREYCPTDAEHKRWNTAFAGKQALNHRSGDYRRGAILGQNYMAHRVIWALAYGEWPREDIDHIDGNPSNNRLDNLRAVTTTENQRNKSIPVTNTSGCLGVRWVEEKQKYRVEVGEDGKRKHIGFYADKLNAMIARDAASRALGYASGHGRSRRALSEAEG